MKGWYFVRKEKWNDRKISPRGRKTIQRVRGKGDRDPETNGGAQKSKKEP